MIKQQKAKIKMQKKIKYSLEHNEISEDRKKYLKNIKLTKMKIFITQISIVIVFIVAWEMLARLRKNR